MIIDKELLKRIKYLIGITLGVYLAIRYLLPLVIPFLLAVLLSALIHPIAVFFFRKIKIPYKMAAIILVFLVVSVILIVFGVILYYAFSQARELASGYPFIKEKVIVNTKEICSVCDEWLGISGGKMYSTVVTVSDYLNDNFSEKIMPLVTERAWSMCVSFGKGIVIVLFFIIGTTLILEQYRDIINDCKSSFLVKRCYPVIKCLKNTVYAYIKTEVKIFLIVALVCTIGLFIIKNPYALLIGILIALVDSLPVIGSGSILVPWAIVSLLSGKYIPASVLLTLYLICLITREFLEAKLMGQHMGLRPIYTFISFFIGIKLFGIAGIFLGPIAMVTIRFIYMSAIKKSG